MHTRSISLVCTLLALSALSFADDQPSQQQPAENCGKGWHPYRVSARHIEANGIGYDQGYTTIEGFFAGMYDSWTPFLDTRVHVFNNGRPALNAGIGLRGDYGYILGANLYYDYRKTKHTHFSQISAGLEALGPMWEARANGYFPVGHKSSGFFDTHFKKFQGNHIILQRKREIAMAGVDGEVGAHFCKLCDVDFFAGIGPYYFAGNGSRSTVGGKFRLTGRWKEYIMAEGTISYDSVFRDIYQGQLGVSIPFGGRKTIAKSESRSCSDAVALNHRRLQPVVKDEIIVVERRKTKTLAVNPLTGEPYQVWFVNNTSHSAGTFESPFSTLADAQNASHVGDMIYIYPGDGTSTGMDQGITLKNNQLLFGAGIAQSVNTSFGVISIPAQASMMPLVTNVNATLAAHPIVGIANGNTIAGLNLTLTNGSALSSCIEQADAAAAVLGFSLKSCLVRNASATKNGITTTQLAGPVTIKNSAFFTATTATILSQTIGGQDANYQIRNNAFIFPSGIGVGMSRVYTDGTNTEVTTLIRNNYFQTTSGIGIAIVEGQTGSTSTLAQTLTIVGNTMDGVVGGVGTAVNYTSAGLHTQAVVNVSSNTITNFDAGIFVTSSNASRVTSTLARNNLTRTSGPSVTDFGIVSADTSTHCTSVDNNTGGLVVPGILSFSQLNTSSLKLLSVQGNSLLTQQITGSPSYVTSCE